MIIIKTAEEIELMRKAASILGNTLEHVRTKTKAGVTTGELDAHAEEFIREKGGIPAFKGYRGFPATICSSVNDEVVHGIPGERELQDGDIITVDCGVIWEEFYSDAAITISIGEISKDVEQFLKVVEASLYNGIDQAVNGNRIGDISNAIQTTVEPKGYSVVRDLIGHGIGKNLHEEPQIPNFGQKGTGPLIKPGMTFAIEVMINMGGEAVRTLEDNWTIVTKDGSLSAQIEHTVLITSEGNEILTHKTA
jgi:methionyl aminopeptidase